MFENPFFDACICVCYNDVAWIVVTKDDVVHAPDRQTRHAKIDFLLQGIHYLYKSSLVLSAT